MPTNDDLLATVREALAAATPGPWRDVPMGSEGSVVLVGGNTARTSRRVARAGEYADAHLIANAPTWLADLCDLVESWRQTAADYHEEIVATHAERDGLRARLDAAERVCRALARQRDAGTARIDHPIEWDALPALRRATDTALDAWRDGAQ